jgi:hypothetical protein
MYVHMKQHLEAMASGGCMYACMHVYSTFEAMASGGDCRCSTSYKMWRSGMVAMRGCKRTIGLPSSNSSSICQELCNFISAHTQLLHAQECHLSTAQHVAIVHHSSSDDIQNTSATFHTRSSQAFIALFIIRTDGSHMQYTCLAQACDLYGNSFELIASGAENL